MGHLSQAAEDPTPVTTNSRNAQLAHMRAASRSHRQSPPISGLAIAQGKVPGIIDGVTQDSESEGSSSFR
jgi:hypothetical protein